jgi:hypothetical protein
MTAWKPPLLSVYGSKPKRPRATWIILSVMAFAVGFALVWFFSGGK